MWLREILAKIKARMTLSPPAVEPAEPPINIKRSKIHWENKGQCARSVIPKPVVVMMVDTSKKTFSKPSVKLSYIPRTLSAIRAVATSTIPR